jgi:hypothetical protein
VQLPVLHLRGHLEVLGVVEGVPATRVVDRRR